MGVSFRSHPTGRSRTPLIPETTPRQSLARPLRRDLLLLFRFLFVRAVPSRPLIRSQPPGGQICRLVNPQANRAGRFQQPMRTTLELGPGAVRRDLRTPCSCYPSRRSPSHPVTALSEDPLRPLFYPSRATTQPRSIDLSLFNQGQLRSVFPFLLPLLQPRPQSPFPRAGSGRSS